MLRPWNSNRAPSSIEDEGLVRDQTRGLILDLILDPILVQTQGLIRDPIRDPIRALIRDPVDGRGLNPEFDSR